MMLNYLKALFSDWWFAGVWVLLLSAIAYLGWIVYTEKDLWP